MAAIEIPCPQCGRMLRLADRRLVGRKGRCAKCGHKFLLQEPVALGSLSGVHPAESPAGEDADEETLLGVDAKWVSESNRSTVPDVLPPAASLEAARPATEFISDTAGGALDMTDHELDSGTAARLRQFRKKSGWPRWIWIAAAVALFVSGGAGWYFFGPTAGRKVDRRRAAKAEQSSPATEMDDDLEPPDASSAPTTARGEKRKKSPITLQYVPMGARVVVHLRPAELWRDGGGAEELRACLDPVVKPLEAMIRRECLYEPSKIEELLLALIPTGRETFEMAVVVRTVADVKRSELIEKFDGQLADKPRPHYVGPKKAYLIADSRTFAIAPREMAESLVEAASGPAVTSEGVEALLPQTDRRKHFTLVCELEDVRNGIKGLAADVAQPLLAALVDFFGDDVETLAWSFRLGDPAEPSGFTSELLMRNRLTRSPANLVKDLKQKVDDLPPQVLELVYRTNPRKLGEKKLVGRFPKMTWVIKQKAVYSTGSRLVRLNVELPERAGPNLALGALLTWDQTTRPEFGKSTTPAAGPGKTTDASLTIAQRLAKKITVEFKKTPFEDAIRTIGTEAGIDIALDGKGLQLIGMTKNKPQELTLEDTPAAAVLDRLLKKFDLVLIVDETKKTATVTSAKAAADQKLKPFALEAIK